MAATFSGKAEAVQATSEAELTKLHAKIVDRRRHMTP
jgi:hypothetical protein